MNGNFVDYECPIMCGVTNNNFNLTQYYDVLKNIKCDIDKTELK
jgi:hypothetical protein